MFFEKNSNIFRPSPIVLVGKPVISAITKEIMLFLDDIDHSFSYEF